MNNKKFNNVIAVIVVLTLAVGVFAVKNLFWKNDEDQFDTMRDSNDFFDEATDDTMRETILYYKDDNGFIVPVMRKIPWETGIAKATLRNMTDDVVLREDIGTIGLLPIIPVGTEVFGMSINEGLCKVDFSSQILNYESKQDEIALVTGIVYALTEFEAISEVQIMINGENKSSLAYGTDLSKPLARKDINLTAEASGDQTKVVVYYKGTTNGIDEYYVPVTIPTNAPSENIQTALKELFKGPDEYIGLWPDIPATAEFLGVEVNNGIAYVNINESAKESLKDQATFEAMSKSIALTLEQFAEIENIEILLEGITLEEAGIEIITSDTLPVFANEY